MIYEKDGHKDIDKEYFEQDQPDKKQTGNYIDSYGENKKPLIVTELLRLPANDGASTQVARIIRPPESIFTLAQKLH